MLRPFCLLLLILVTVVAFAPPTTAAAARPRLSFTETYRDVRTDESWTQQGRVEISVTLPMQGISLRQINAKTAFLVGLGGVASAGALGDDPNYRPGKRKARIRDGARTILLEWDRRKVVMTLRCTTGRAEPSALAADRITGPDGRFRDKTRSFNSFGDRTTGVDVSYKGRKTTVNGIRKVTMEGGGNKDCGCT